jgi:hypothetical protein
VPCSACWQARSRRRHPTSPPSIVKLQLLAPDPVWSLTPFQGGSSCFLVISCFCFCWLFGLGGYVVAVKGWAVALWASCYFLLAWGDGPASYVMSLTPCKAEYYKLEQAEAALGRLS